LTNANLKGADLTGVNLEGANLEGTNLFEANLVNAKNFDTALTKLTSFCKTRMPDGTTKSNPGCETDEEGGDPPKVAGTYIGEYGGKNSEGDWSDSGVFHFYQHGDILRGVMITDYPLYRFAFPEVVDENTYKGAGVYPWWDSNQTKIEEFTDKVTLTWTSDYTEFSGTWRFTGWPSDEGWFKGSNESVSQKAQKEYCIVDENQNKTSNVWTRQTGVYSHENSKSMDVFAITCGEWGETVGLDEAIQGAINYNKQKVARSCQRCDFGGADLAGQDLTGAALFGSDLAGANLTEADLTDANLTEADLNKANLEGADLTEVSLTNAYLIESDLAGADLTRARLNGANLTGANLTGANLTRAELKMANLTKAQLTGANLPEANLWKANLTEANLTKAELIDAHLTEANLTEANLTRARLNGAKLNRANLVKANLEGANLTEADLTDANLTDANLTKAKLNRSDLTGVNLEGANLTGAKLTEGQLFNATLCRTQLPWGEEDNSGC